MKTNPGWSSTPTKSISTILNIILQYVRTQSEGEVFSLKFENLRSLSENS